MKRAAAAAAVPVTSFAAMGIPAAPQLWRVAKALPLAITPPRNVDWAQAAVEPAATPAEPKPSAPTIAGATMVAPAKATAPNAIAEASTIVVTCTWCLPH
uniref:Putative secreted protein n=1 Tax=Ixodes ricinus TaxID=34613 RepID=A0A6B0UGJ8_IXORI